ncbi:type III PLP-dependent enzyme [Sessilibacter corallicola]|uniref:ornithine decarboxylase n=1 Tax=Sessilibacter corallicola TaxID=2904075 RepID=A0ABQ0A502_9GAMM|nr:type III PLP-dependent enzyme [Sessilibacter corallicola]
MASVSLPAPPVTISPASEAEIYRKAIETHGSPLLVINPAKIRRAYRSLNDALPGVGLYFAIKANPHRAVVKTLAECGASFDIATSGEIELLREIKVRGDNCIHTHPIKRDKDIRDALRYGCTKFVVDNLEEIKKFIPYRNRVGILLRVSFPNPNSPVDLSKKFGCTPDNAIQLAETATEMGIKIKGFSFHAGSQCACPENHTHAVERCAELLMHYNETHEQNMSILDIGGGFPVPYDNGTPDIESFCAPIRNALKLLPEHIAVIAEPGRFLVADAATAVSTVIGVADRCDGRWYYLDDGVYGSYSGRIYDHANYPIRVFSDETSVTHPTIMAGPTCDSIDVFAENINIPELKIGDLVVGEMMGAYTNATATDFNLFPRAKIIESTDAAF